MKKRLTKLIMISTLTLGGVTLFTSCDKHQDNGEDKDGGDQKGLKTYELYKNDATNISTLAEYLGETDGTGFSAKVEDGRIAKVIGYRVFAVSVGETNIKLTKSDKELNLILKVSQAEELDVEYLNDGCSVGGILIDINANRTLGKHNSYTFTISVNNAIGNHQEIQVAMSNEDVCEYDYSNGLHTLITHGYGDCMIKIFNADNILIYRNNIKVRNSYENEEEYLFALTSTCDYWGGWGALDGLARQDSSTITFIDYDNVIYEGYDGSQKFGPLSFKIEYDGEINDEIVGYKIIDYPSGHTEFTPKRIGLFKECDQLLLYGETDYSYLLDIYVPRMNKDKQDVTYNPGLYQ